MKRHVTFALAISAAWGGMAAWGVIDAAAQPAANPIEAHLAAAKAAAGFDFPGLLARNCVAPQTAEGPDVAPPPPPDRASWYTEPAKVFDNLYFVGTKIHSAWAMTGREGIILLDTLYDYASEEAIVGGLKKLGLDPTTVKYVIVTHAHGDHDGGAKLMQDRFGSRIIMGGPDWDRIENSINRYPNGKPRRDMVALDGQKVVLGDAAVTLALTPGHTAGTVSMFFEVKDNGKPLSVAYSGGTAFNFPNDVPHFDTYIYSQRKMGRFRYRTGLQYLVATVGESGVSATKQKTSALPFSRNTPAPPLGGWVTPATV
jgi:metallo-beta-lactamase class B